MKPKHLYLALCVVGILVPYSYFVPWLFEHGLDLALFFRELSANRITNFFAADVIVSAAGVVAYMSVERRRLPIRARWLPALALVTVGVSLALPLFLYLRERALEHGGPHSTAVTA